MPALFLNNLRPRHERLAALSLAVLAAAAIAWTLWRYVPAWLPSRGGGAADGVAATRSTGTGEVRSLADYHLFGGAPGKARPDTAAPVTELDLTLNGTLSASNGGDALAIIADSDGTERRYHVGDELPGGATLDSVSPGAVTLRYRGRVESLPLRKPDADNAGPGRSRGSGRDAGEVGSAPDLARTRRELLADPAALARQVSVLPVQENGEMVGVRLASSGNSASLLSRLGLRSSDVITSVNGIPLNDLSRGNAIAEQLKNADHLKVNVIRNGETMQLDIALDQ